MMLLLLLEFILEKSSLYDAVAKELKKFRRLFGSIILQVITACL